MGTPSVIIEGPSPHNWKFYWETVPHRILKAVELPCVPCETLGGPKLGRCTNWNYSMGCMKEITIDRAESAVHELLEILGGSATSVAR